MSLSVTDFGTVGQNQTTDFSTVDDTPAFQAAINACAAQGQTEILVPRGFYNLSGPYPLNAYEAIRWIGEGYNESGKFGAGFSGQTFGEQAQGTWIKLNCQSRVGITINSGASRGTSFENIAFVQDHPAPAPGWAPTNYDFMFDIVSTAGSVEFRNVMFRGVNRGIRSRNSARLKFWHIEGQFFTNGIDVDQAYDVCYVGYVHHWPFWSNHPAVSEYQQGNLDLLTFGRVDGLHVSHVFGIYCKSVLKFLDRGSGPSTDVLCDYVYADGTVVAVRVEAPAVTLRIGLLVGNGGAVTAGQSAPNGSAIYIASGASGCFVTLGTLISQRNSNSAVRNLTGSTIRINDWSASNYSGAPLWYSPSEPIQVERDIARDFSGTDGADLELNRAVYVRYVAFLGEFADDAAAAAGGVPVASNYRRPDGLIAWRRS